MMFAKTMGSWTFAVGPTSLRQIFEASQSPSMRMLLIRLAQPESQIFTVGCDLGIKFLSEDTLPYTAGGYVQIMSAVYADRSPDDYARFAAAVTEMLESGSQDHEWHVHFILTPVAFKLDRFSGMTGSLWIWFHAFETVPFCPPGWLSESSCGNPCLASTRRTASTSFASDTANCAVACLCR
jgi:hypothetical protein